jgi:hypothetical protein
MMKIKVFVDFDEQISAAAARVANEYNEWAAENPAANIRFIDTTVAPERSEYWPGYILTIGYDEAGDDER